jgi:hypothetical protein
VGRQLLLPNPKKCLGRVAVAASERCRRVARRTEYAELNGHAFFGDTLNESVFGHEGSRVRETESAASSENAAARLVFVFIEKLSSSGTRSATTCLRF